MSTESQFLPIQSLDIEAESAITFDLYVNLPLNQKYLLYRRRGGKMASESLEKFNSKNLKNFFIHKEDYQEFVKYVAQRIKAMIGMESSEDSKKMMVTTAKAILSSTFSENNPAVTRALISNLNDITGVIIESALENSLSYNKKIFHRFASLAKRGTDFQRHPVNVTSLAVLITFGIGYSKQEILSEVAMAGLLHDIGLSSLSPSSIAKAHTPEELSPTERPLLYRHPEASIQILKDKKVEVSPLLETLILQHHEEFNGFGYPKGLRGFQINELSQIILVADRLDQLVAEGYSNNLSLKLRLRELLESFIDRKTIEPSLARRIRGILI